MTHNPWSVWCTKRLINEPWRITARCPICDITYLIQEEP